MADRLRELASIRRRFGYRRLHVLLVRDGIRVNHKHVYRIYAAKLQVRKRVKRRVALGCGDVVAPALGANERWSLDFVHDTLQNGRRIRTLNVVGDFTREALAIEVDTSISGSRVARVLDRVAAERGAYPKRLVMDNGTELTSLAMLAWASSTHVESHYIAPGKPTRNDFVESLNGKFSDERLNDHIFPTLHEVRRIIEAWRIDYNELRPHRSLGQLTPSQFAQLSTHY